MENYKNEKSHVPTPNYKLYSTYLFWTVLKSLKFTHLTFIFKMPKQNWNSLKLKSNNCMHNHIQMNPSTTQITILNTFINLIFQPYLWPHLKTIQKYLKIKKWMLPLKFPYIIQHFIHGLLSPKICTFWDMDPSKFELFDLKNPKIWNSHNPSLHIIPNPN